MHKFDIFYKKLLEYKEEYGDCLVPVKFVTSDSFKLGRSVHYIRRGDIRINAEERKLLDEIGFVWHVRIVRKFERIYELLLEYKDKYGNCLVPRTYITTDGIKLGYIVSNLRQKKRSLSDDNFQLLEEIGFVWECTRPNFEEIYKLILSYKEEKGNCLVPQKYVTSDGINLGSYVQRIRSGYIPTTDEQKELLNEIGFVWRVKRRMTFHEKIELFLIYKKEYGNCKVPQRYVTDDGVNLGVIAQNIRAGNIKLTEEEKQKLDEIGFEWGIRKSK